MTVAKARFTTLTHNPASQIIQAVRTGDAYAWTCHFSENKTGTANGLNQLTQVGTKANYGDSLLNAPNCLGSLALRDFQPL